MKSFIKFIVLFALLLCAMDVQAQTVTTATGGDAISADLAASGTYVTLTWPAYSESASGNAGAGTIILNVPSGFIFDIGGTAPNVLVTRLGGTGNSSRNINGIADDNTFAITSITTTQITITITASNNGVFCKLTWQNVRVRPTSGIAPLASGNITKSGTSTMSGVTGSTNFGTLTEVIGAANKLTIQQQPSASATAGVAFAQQPIVRIEDQFGNLRSTDTLTVTASRSTGTGTLQGTVSRQAVGGVVTYTNLSYNVAETMTIQFARTGLVSATSNNVVVSPAAVSKLGFTTQPGTATAGAPFGLQPVVKTQDQFGNNSTVGLVPNLDVTVTLTAGTGPLQGAVTLDIGTNAGNGVVSYADLRIDVTGANKQLTASASGLTSGTSSVFTVGSGAVNNFLVEAAGGGAIGTQTAGTAFNIKVTARDTFNNTVTSFVSTVNITSTGNLSAGGGTTPSFVAGVLASRSVTISNVGSFTITATRTSGGSENGTSNSFTVNPGAANKLTIQIQPSPTATAGVLFLQQPVVRIEDQFGNLRSSDNTTMVSARRSAGTGVLQGDTLKQASGGLVSFASLAHNVATTITINFVSGSLVSATSNNIVVSPAAVKRLAFTQQPGSATVYSAFGVQPIIVTQDSFANNSTSGLPVNLDVTMTLIAGTGPLLGTVTRDIGTAAGNGTVTYTDLRLDTAGTNKQLKASASGLDSALSVVFTVNNPAPTTSSISPTSKTARDTAFTMTVNGTNFVPLSTVRFAGSSRTTSFTNSTQVTAQILASDIDTSGTFSITVFNPTPGGGTSGAQTLSVVKRTTSTTVVADTNPSLFGHTVKFTAKVVPGVGVTTPPTGTVEFFDGVTSLGTATMVGDSATRSVSTLAVGGHSITATYKGDTSSTSSTSPAITQTVNKAPTTTGVGSNNNPSVFGQSVTFTATVTPSTATGTVEFFDDTVSLGSSALSGGTATKITSALTGGTHPITAVYSGSGSFFGSTSSILTQTVNKANSTTGIASNKNPVTRLDSVRFTATVTPSTATGNVEFRDSLTTIGTAALSGGTAIFTTNALVHGNHPMTAVYLGSINYNGSTSSTIIQSVKDSSTAIVVSNLNPSAYLDSVTFTATVSPTDSVTGTAQFKDGADTLATLPLSAGSATLKIASLTAGSHTISIVYSGDTKYFGKTSPNLTQTVNKKATAAGLVSNLNPSSYGDSVRFTATITPGTPTGTVTFFDSLTSLGSVSLSSGSAFIVRANLTAKTHRMRALYNGDSNFLTSADSILQVVNKATSSVIVLSSVNPSSYTEQVTFTATVTPSLATGSVEFFDSTTSLGTSAISSGAAVILTSALVKGTHSITAQYSGDANITAGSSAPLSQVVVIMTGGDFEKGATFAANGWTVVNGSQTNQWFVGTAAKVGGLRGVYVSDNNGSSNQYTVTEPLGSFGSVVHFYKDVTFPPVETSIKLIFDWRGVGQGGSIPVDFMNIHLGSPDSLTPVAGVELPEFYQLGSNYLSQATFLTDSIMIEGSVAGTTQRLVFTWLNNDGTGTQPPTALDNIFITSRIPNPLTGIKTIGPGGDYTTFTAAISDLNSNGVGFGGVTFNVTAGTSFTEDPPPVVATGVSGSPIVFQKSGGGANPILKPTGSGRLSDFGFCISGGDYITVDGIDITINSGSAVEYGYLVRNRSTSNGAQNNVIKNCKITLNRSNLSSFGIYQVVGTAGGAGGFPTSSSGANSFNKYYNITVENCYGGIVLQGFFAVPDLSCEVGVTGGGTTTIGSAGTSDIGNGGTSVFGIRAQNQSDVKIFSATVRNLTTSGSSSTCNGIYLDNCFGTALVYNNTIFSLQRNNTGLSGVVYGIRAELTSGNSVIAYNNVIHTLGTANPSSATSNMVLRGIAHNTSGGLTGTGSYYFNSVRVDQGGATNGSSAAFWSGGGTVNYQNNILSNFTGTQSGVPKHYGVYLSAGSVGTASNNVLYSTNGNGFIGYDGTDRSTLQLWAAAISSSAPSDGQEQGSVSGNPNFTLATDLTFAGATPAANGGTPITVPSITTDILGLAGNRSTTPDIGAYETSATLNDQTAPVIRNIVIVSGISPSVSAIITDNSAAATNAIVRLWCRLQGSSGAYTGLDADVKPSGALSGTYSWAASLSALAPGTYTFYISARDTGATATRIWMNPIWTTGFAGFSASDPPNFLNNPASYANVRTFTVDLTIVQLKVFLEGAYVSVDSMRNALKTDGHLASHFGAIPIPFRAVDSINIEIRDSAVASSATMRLFAPAWLLRDGTIRSFSDTSKASVNFNIVPGNYYIVVRHRNHLAIMSTNAIALSSSSVLYDFSSGSGQAYSNGQKQISVSPLRFGMIAGNVDGNTGIGASDIVQIRGSVGFAGYAVDDVDLNGGVGASDIVVARGNVGQTTQVP